MVKVNVCRLICVLIFSVGLGLTSCESISSGVGAPSITGSSSPAPSTTLDQTATAVAQIIEDALSATPLVTNVSMTTALLGLPATETAYVQQTAIAVATTLTMQATPMPNLIATTTTEAQRLATMVAATLAALPTATPNHAATATTQNQNMATAVAATLTAQPTNTPTATPTENIIATQTVEANRLATAVAATLAIQPRLISTDTPVPSANVFAYRTNEQALQNLSSLWSLTTFQDLDQPGTETYNISITGDQDWRWAFAWCAIDRQRLQEILQPLTVNLLVDDLVLPDAAVLQHQGSTKTGDQCQYWSTALTKWQSGAVVKLDISYFLATAINDGRQNYADGQYHQVIFVYVR